MTEYEGELISQREKLRRMWRRGGFLGAFGWAVETGWVTAVYMVVVAVLVAWAVRENRL